MRCIHNVQRKEKAFRPCCFKQCTERRKGLVHWLTIWNEKQLRSTVKTTLKFGFRLVVNHLANAHWPLINRSSSSTAVSKFLDIPCVSMACKSEARIGLLVRSQERRAAVVPWIKPHANVPVVQHEYKADLDLRTDLRAGRSVRRSILRSPEDLARVGEGEKSRKEKKKGERSSRFQPKRFLDMPCVKRVYRDTKASVHWSAARNEERLWS